VRATEPAGKLSTVTSSAAARSRTTVTDVFFFATLATVTWEKVHWEPGGGNVSLSEVFAAGFILLFGLERLARRDGLVSRPVIRIGLFGVAFLLVYLIGFYNLDTQQALGQYGKGIGKYLLHFAFLVAGAAYVVRRSERFYWRSLGWFCAGITASAVYGILQLASARAGHNLDELVLSPLTGGASQINVFGGVQGESVYRPNALTGDPNHLGIMLVVPLLVLTPIYLRLERAHRLKLPLGVLLAFLLVIELSTLSRSGLLGLAAGAVVLAFPYRRRLLSLELLLPLAGVLAVIAWVVSRRLDFFEQVFRARTQTSGASTSAHFDVYGFIPDVVQTHPLFGLGLNNFSVYYEFVTGKDNWGPHSFYVALLVEGGLVGTALFAVFLWYVFKRLGVLRQAGRLLAEAGDPAAARVRPLAWGLTAALVGTMAANVFYLTMTFFYFLVFVLFAVAAPVVFGRRVAVRDEPRPRRPLVGEPLAVGPSARAR
jgi:O-antigen ligase